MVVSMVEEHYFFKNLVLENRTKEVKEEMKNNLKKLLEKDNMSVEELSEKAKVGLKGLRQMLKGNSIPCISECIAICDYFNCSMDYLFCRTDMRARL